MKAYYEREGVRIYHGDCREVLGSLDSDSVDCCVTSPPYWGLRDYGIEPSVWGDNLDPTKCAGPGCEHEWGEVGPCHHPGQVEQTKWKTAEAAGKGQTAGSGQFCQHCGAWKGALGLEPTPQLFIEHMVSIFEQVRRVLKPEGTCWLNIGDSYASSPPGCKGVSDSSGLNGAKGDTTYRRTLEKSVGTKRNTVSGGLKPKDLCLIPFRLAIALQEAGWWVRSDIIWCLSGGTVVYARTQKGDMPTTVKDLARLKPETVKFWNGEKWTQLLGMNRTKREGEALELVLRSGERISCTGTHRFPTQRGVIAASEIAVGDVLESCILPEPDAPRTPAHIDEDAAWLAGLYIAEGSRSGSAIQIAGHAKEETRWLRLRRIAGSYGGSATRTISGNKMEIRLYGRVLHAVIDELVSGRTAKDKCFAPVCWRYSNVFLNSMLKGYLAGDGHWDAKNERWRLGFTRNYNLERDLRTVCARLGLRLTLNLSTVKYQGGTRPSFRGEIRVSGNGHHNEKSRSEVVEIRKARCREVYDLGVEDEPHLFALASGVLTHNSKPNPMPESVRDRPTKAHEYVFLLAKSEKYWFDAAAVAEPNAGKPSGNGYRRPHRLSVGGRGQEAQYKPDKPRNIRSVWTIATQPFPEAHFAVFPEKLVEPCIKAGCPAGGTVLDPFTGAGTTAVVAKRMGCRFVGAEMNSEYIQIAAKRLAQGVLAL